MLQPPSEMAEGQEAALKEDLKVKGMDIPQIREDEGREPCLGSGCSDSSGIGPERLLLASSLNDAKLEHEKLRLTVIQTEVAFNAMPKSNP